VVAHLQEVVSARSDLALALVAVDDERAAALSLASLAVACAREGKQVVLADLCGGAPAARLLGAGGRRGVGAVNVRGTRVTVVVPGVDAGVPAGPLRRGSLPAWQSSRELPGGSDDGGAAGPLRRGPVLGWQQPSRELAAACASADVLLTLVRLDPALGAEHLASWADEAVVMVAAGRSSWTKIHAVGEMIRLAGTPLVSAVLVDADKTDESVGLLPTRTPPPMPLKAQDRTQRSAQDRTQRSAPGSPGRGKRSPSRGKRSPNGDGAPSPNGGGAPPSPS
jgi:hypothetical protein